MIDLGFRSIFSFYKIQNLQIDTLGLLLVCICHMYHNLLYLIMVFQLHLTI